MSILNFTAPVVNLKLEAGDDPIIGFNFWSDKAKTIPFDLTGFTGLASTIRSPTGAESSLIVIATGGASGQLAFQVDGSAIRTFPARGCMWDARVVTPDGREVTIAQGRVKIKQDVTISGGGVSVGNSMTWDDGTAMTWEDGTVMTWET